MNDVKNVIHRLTYKHRLNKNIHEYHKLYFLDDQHHIRFRSNKLNAYNYRQLRYKKFVNPHIFNDLKGKIRAVAFISKNYL